MSASEPKEIAVPLPPRSPNEDNARPSRRRRRRGGGGAPAPGIAAAATPPPPPLALGAVPRRDRGAAHAGKEPYFEQAASRPSPSGLSLEAGALDATTLVLHCLPPEYTRDTLVKMLEEHGFRGRVDFVYLPCKLTTGESFGYAFVNFSTRAAALEAQRFYTGFSAWQLPSDRVCHVKWARINGLQANVEHFRNSPLMHELVTDGSKPIILDPQGRRVSFPLPTRKLRAPSQRRSR